jgi:peptidoglycan/LPS O-acetylase OafA/YrhL
MGALRLLLAVSVVLFHARGLFHYELVGGTVAVETFFMISGFVMALVLTTKYAPVQDRRLFYTNRMLRIYAPYFAMVGVALAIATFAFFHAGAGPFVAMRAAALTPGALLATVVTNITILGQDLFVFFGLDHGALRWTGAAPTLNVVVLQLIPPAWSISLELMFYALAPWLVRFSNRALVAIVAASLCLRLLFWRAGLPSDPWSYRFFPSEICFFVAGMLACRLYQSAARRRSGVDQLLGIGLILAVFAYQPAADLLQQAGLSTEWGRWSFYALAFAGMPALFAWTNRSALDRFLGDFSYPVYLAHWPVMVLIDALNPRLAPDARAGAMLAVSLALAYVIAEWVEKPVDRRRQRRVAERAGTRPATAPAARPGLEETAVRP